MIYFVRLEMDHGNGPSQSIVTEAQFQKLCKVRQGCGNALSQLVAVEIQMRIENFSCIILKYDYYVQNLKASLLLLVVRHV